MTDSWKALSRFIHHGLGLSTFRSSSVELVGAEKRWRRTAWRAPDHTRSTLCAGCFGNIESVTSIVSTVVPMRTDPETNQPRRVETDDYCSFLFRFSDSDAFGSVTLRQSTEAAVVQIS